MPIHRVLIAAHHYPPRRVGGAELFAQRLAQWLVTQGIEVQVICIEDVARGDATRIHWQDEPDGPVRVQRLNLTLAPGDDLRLWFDSPLLRERCDALLNEWQPELVHLVSGYLIGTAPLEAARSRNIPTVVTLNDFWFLCPTIQLLRGDGSLCAGPEPLECARCLYDERRAFRLIDQRAPNVMRAFWKTLETQPRLGAQFDLPQRLETLRRREQTLAAALHRTDAVMVFTNFAREMFVSNGVNADKIIVKPYGIKWDEFEPVTARRPNPGVIRFGYLGQVTPIKGVDTVMRAFLQVQRANRSPKRLELAIHGNLNAQPSYVRELRKLASESAEIELCGAFEHRRALQLINELDVVVVPSQWYENSPRVVWESFAAGRPVLGTRVGGIAELVQDGVNGLLFERSVDDLARVMQRIVDEPGLLSRLTGNIPTLPTFEMDMRDVMGVYTRVAESRAAERAQ